MTILSHVSVDFFNRQRELIFSVPSHLIDCVLTAPDEIQQDPIFGQLLADHSLEAVQTIEQRKALENDPTRGVTAEGKKANSDRKSPDRSAANDTDSAAAGLTDPASAFGKSTASGTGEGNKPNAARTPSAGKAG